MCDAMQMPFFPLALELCFGFYGIFGWAPIQRRYHFSFVAKGGTMKRAPSKGGGG